MVIERSVSCTSYHLLSSHFSLSSICTSVSTKTYNRKLKSDLRWLCFVLAVILENFDVATRENAEPLTADDFEQFFEVWQKFDDKLTQLISYDQLQLLLHQLDMPLKGIICHSAFEIIF